MDLQPKSLIKLFNTLHTLKVFKNIMDKKFILLGEQYVCYSCISVLDDLYAMTKYDNDLAWIIMSAQSTGMTRIWIIMSAKSIGLAMTMTLPESSRQSKVQV